MWIYNVLCLCKYSGGQLILLIRCFLKYEVTMMDWNGAVTEKNDRKIMQCSLSNSTLTQYVVPKAQAWTPPWPRTPYLVKQFISFLEFKFLLRQHLTLCTFYESYRGPLESHKIIWTYFFLSRDRCSNTVVSNPAPQLSFLVVPKDILAELWVNLYKHTMRAIQYSQMQQYHLQQW